MRWRSWSVPLLVVAGAACSRHDLVDVAMGSAHRPYGSASPAFVPGFVVLAGDMHCHVAPPDDPSDVVRDLPRTLTLARAEKLDFVVFTPHVGARFFTHAGARKAVAEGQRALREAIAASKADGLLLVPGFEYTDHAHGHVGASFADLDAVLADVPLADAAADPGAFFVRWAARGGVLSIHHPFVTPLPSSSFAIARADLSWRPFTQPAGPFPAEIGAITAHAHGLETFNLTATHLRDRYLVGDQEASLRAAFTGLDHEIQRQHRRLTAFGGSDSHEDHLRAATFVLATAKTLPALREGLVRGRTCVRDPRACTFVATTGDGRRARVGDALEGVTTVTLAVDGDGEGFLDGKPVALGTKLSVPPTCTVLRAKAGPGWSSPIYANCNL